MQRTLTRMLPLALVVLLLCCVLPAAAFAAQDPTELPGTKTILCESCEGLGLCTDCYGLDPGCPACGGANLCAVCGGSGYVTSPSRFFNTPWSLLPPVIAIALALITKEVYSSLFVGILTGGLLYSNFAFEGTVLHVFQGGLVASVTDSYNMGILVFLIILGAMVCLMNKAGGSAAFGRWAKAHIHSRVGVQLVAILLGVLIFIDDYFNCLTVGSVMRPITDAQKVSRAKLAYIIDATAAPVCIIAPVSSWAAAVSAFAEDGQGFSLFLRAIPYNYYALLTIAMMLALVLLRADYGPMARFERNAKEKGDLFSGANPYADAAAEADDGRGRVLDLVFPVAVLVVFCVIGMLYSGGFFSGVGLVEAFSASDASVGLMLGSAFALAATFLYYAARRAMPFKTMMDCVPEGFKSMVPAILILTFAWTLKGMTDSLGAKYFVRDLVNASAGGFVVLLPVIVFLVGCFLSFSTGTSWGTFGILIPIVQGIFSMDDPMAILCISACMAGAVCGDHCSPISDTTIMASAGAQCDHVNHVTTQLPYAFTCSAVSAVTYLAAGALIHFGAPGVLALPVGLALLLVTLLVLRRWQASRG